MISHKLPLLSVSNQASPLSVQRKAWLLTQASENCVALSWVTQSTSWWKEYETKTFEKKEADGKKPCNRTRGPSSSPLLGWLKT